MPSRWWSLTSLLIPELNVTLGGSLHCLISSPTATSSWLISFPWWRDYCDFPISFNCFHQRKKPNVLKPSQWSNRTILSISMLMSPHRSGKYEVSSIMTASSDQKNSILSSDGNSTNSCKKVMTPWLVYSMIYFWPFLCHQKLWKSDPTSTAVSHK